LNQLEEFYLDLYYAKLQLVSNRSGYAMGIWNESTQKNIDALSYLVNGDIEIEAYIFAAKNHFKDKITYSEIIEVFKTSYKALAGRGNKNAFTVYFFNWLNLHIQH
jgi:hypothetical protein